VLPLEPTEWSMYMNQWAQFTQEGEPYPATEFRPAQLYVYEGEPGGGGGEVPEGLIMVWGGPSTPKWSQPPVPYSSPRLFNGWDQISMYGQKLAADDWVCHDAGPVTDLRWWGSFIGWHEPYPPPLPDAFAITIWTDVPAGVGGADFSHAGTCIHYLLCTDYQWAFAGWDIDPRGGPAVAPETTFEFACFLDRSQWFWQEPGEHIYWVSIAAVYNIGVPPYPFGWKTRPRR